MSREASSRANCRAGTVGAAGGGERALVVAEEHEGRHRRQHAAPIDGIRFAGPVLASDASGGCIDSSPVRSPGYPGWAFAAPSS